MFIENLLGETEKLVWIQWRTAFPEEFVEIIARAENPQNVTSQIRRIFLLEDPYTGSTAAQDQAYIDLERLTCNSLKDIKQYM